MPVSKWTAIQERLRGFPEVDKGKTPGPVTLEDGSVLAGAVAGNPSCTGSGAR